MDLIQIGGLIGSCFGVISFIMYFPLKKREINTKIENDSVDTLSKVVEGLKGELERKDEQIVELKEGQRDLRNRLTNLERKDGNNDIALASVTICDYYRKHNSCPILDKRKELTNE